MRAEFDRIVSVFFHVCARVRTLATIIAAIPVATAIVVPHAQAQQHNMKFDRLTSEHGLSDNDVYCMLVDRMGFMWIGTRDGLNRYDGHGFTVFRHNPEDSGTISDASVGSILQDAGGTIWVGTDGGGVNRFNPVNNTFHSYKHSASDPTSITAGTIKAIVQDRDKTLWIATFDQHGGMSRYNPFANSFEQFQYDPQDVYSLSDNKVIDACVDGNGTLWVATADSGINRFDAATCRFINHRTMPAYRMPDRVDAITYDQAGSLWVIVKGVPYLLNPGTHTVVQYPAARPSNNPLSRSYSQTVFRDRTGTIWIGTTLHGLEVHDRRRSFILKNEPANPSSLSANNIRCMLQDGAGNIWIGTDKGVNKLGRRNWQFEYYQHDPGDTNSIVPGMIRSIHEDPDQTLWVGTEAGGLNRITPRRESVRHYTPGGPNSLPDKTVNVVYRDRANDLWVGTNGGLCLYQPGTDNFKRYTHTVSDSASLSMGGVWAVLEDSRGDMWVGTLNGGLNRMDRTTGKFTHYTRDPKNPHSISHNQALSLLEDRAGNFWVGTNGGLDRMDRATGRFTAYRNNPLDTTSLSNDRIWYIHQDRQNYLWLATSGGGVNRFDPRTGKTKRYMEKQGLANNTACAIVEDDHGRMWVSTSNGISCIDPHTDSIRNYTASDGLYVHVFHFKSCARNRSGYIYFGGDNGIIKFHPDSLADNTHRPLTVITGFKTFDKTLPLDTAITLKKQVDLARTDNFFTIEFAALDFTTPEHNRYRFKLEGIDNGWRSTDGGRPYADYTEVPPGVYTFVVYGSNNNGVETLAPTRLTVYVHPAFWQTWWFQLLVLLLLLGLVSGAVLLRIRNVRRKERLDRQLVEYQLKALQAQMNPHFIFNSLNSILHFVMTRDAESAHAYLSKFSRLMRATLENSTHDTITLADELESLRLYLELESLRFDHSFAYEITVGDDVDITDIEIPPILIQPYVENAIKHGLAHRDGRGVLRVDIRRSGHYLLCSIIDNGIGRARAREIQARQLTDHRSYGMEVTRNRLDVLSSMTRQKFSLDVIDLVDAGGNAAGTRVDLYLPLEAAKA